MTSNGAEPDKPRRPGRPRNRAVAVAPSREKERYAWQLFVEGHTAGQIATMPGRDGKALYKTTAAAQEAIKRASAYMRPIEDLAELRSQSLAGMQAARQEVWDILHSDQDNTVRLRAARTLERIDARIGALMGLDAAIKFEHSGLGGGPIEHNVRVSALMQRAENIVLLPQERLVNRPDEDDRAEEA